MSFFSKKKLKVDIDKSNLPKHVGIIMDGNGRWAQKRGLPRTAGHAAGIKTFKTISIFAKELGLEQVTFYAFSTENWKRPQEEIDKIMLLLDEYVEEGLKEYQQRQVRVRFIGDLSPISKPMVEKIRRLEQLTEQYAPKTLNIALNYGGRKEIADGVKRIAAKVQNGEISPEQIDENLISKHLYFEDLSECDLIIRPSGEYRLSNFLLWQSAYSEYWFDDILWPDFKPEDLERAISHYQKRQRRFGAI